MTLTALSGLTEMYLCIFNMGFHEGGFSAYFSLVFWRYFVNIFGLFTQNIPEIPLKNTQKIALILTALLGSSLSGGISHRQDGI